MAIDYDLFFTTHTKQYASANKTTQDFKANVDLMILNTMAQMAGDVDNENELRSLLTLYDLWKRQQDGISASLVTQYSTWLQTDGRDIIGSSEARASLIAANLATFMTRDAQSVLTNVISTAVTYDKVSDGTLTVNTQNQMTTNDVITLTCTTAQTGVINAVFTARSKNFGAISGTFTANGSPIAGFGAQKYGVDSFTITAGTAGHYWAVSDVITLTLTSDDRSFLLNFFRDGYTVLLPTSASPTISNTLTVVGSFPANPVNGEMAVVNGVLYIYDSGTAEWVENP